MKICFGDELGNIFHYHQIVTLLSVFHNSCIIPWQIIELLICFHNWNFPSFTKEGQVEFSKFSQKGRVQIFPIKKEGLVKWGIVLKKGVPLIFILTLSSVILLSVWCVFVLFIYTNYISIACVSHEELTLAKSNQQMHDFYK